MTTRSSQPDPLPPRPLSKWIIRVGALVVLAVAVVVAVVSWSVLRHLYGGQGAQVQLDVIRTAGTLVIGTGGAVALLLTARRQRYTELALVHTDRDATERRITELYTKAADQLGSEKAPVRLAGLYALERLAQNTPEQRQTIVDVICAYLRMPYTPPDEQPPAEDAPAKARTRYENRRQEQQVRLTAQNILSRNLRRDVSRRLRWWYPVHPYPAWPRIGLNLAEAALFEFSLWDCQLDYADFTRAQFTGRANFEMAEFVYWASFEGAQFTGEADFQQAKFADKAAFRSRRADFEDARFTGRANFEYARFTRTANFKLVKFSGGATFGYGEFPFLGSDLLPRWVFFLLGPRADCHFADEWPSLGNRVSRRTCSFNFEGAQVDSAAGQGVAWPPGWTTRPAKPDNGEDPAFRYLTKVVDGKGRQGRSEVRRSGLL